MTTHNRKIHKAISKGKTILGVGPMSTNCIDAVIEVANKQKIPIQLIASRRQVECSSLGGGYVMTTEALAKYVRSKDKGKFVYLARDHGGPWQGINESKLNYREAMTRAFLSYHCDVLSGFDIIHIDPSLRSRPVDEITRDIKSLHSFCETLNKNLKNKEILYECGTEEHGGQITDPESFEMFVKEVKDLRGMQFVVGNMGYWVKELENVGSLDEKNTKHFVQICNNHNLYLKGHNSDYLSYSQLQQYNDLGVHSINIAPELGACETRALLFELLCSHKDGLITKFVDLAVKSKKWQKWMKSENRRIPNFDKAKICGHYIFNDPKIKEIKEKGKVNDEVLKGALKITITNRLNSLGWKIK